MNERFCKEFDLRTSDFDCRGNLQPAAVLELFQEVAGEHAERLGIGYDAMLERQLVWVLVKVKYEVLGGAKMYQRVRLRTWPLPPARVGFEREYVMEDLDGAMLARGCAEWVLMHSEKRKLMPLRDVYPFQDGLDTEPVFDGRLGKVPDFETADGEYRVTPGFSDLDVNRHVNNTRYANYVLDAAPPGENERIALFQLDYHREVRSGTALLVRHHRSGGEVLLKGMSGEGEKMFSCRMVLTAEE